VRQEFGTMKLSKVTRRHHQLFINRFGANHSKNTVMQDHTFIRTCVKDAVSEGLIQKDFTDRIELVWDKHKGREIKYLSVKEINRLVDYALTHPTVENRLIVAGLYTGARLGELSALTWQDVNEPFKTVTISKSMEAHTREIKEPKNKYSKRTIRVNQAFFDLIKPL
ncbi:UNVERIFIED_CONTAM: site-specific integrase, partial [Lactobacillus helveticus]|nr:site-specific integrase [Lactobacillus helveticus]